MSKKSIDGTIHERDIRPKREFINDDSYELFINAVIRTAVTEYINSYVFVNLHPTSGAVPRHEHNTVAIKLFFESEWFEKLTRSNLDGGYVFAMIQDMADEKLQKKLKKLKKKEVKV